MVKSNKKKKDQNYFAKIIQVKWRKIMDYKRTIQNEIIFFNKIIKEILQRLTSSYKNNIISVNDYKKRMIELDNTILELNFFPLDITLNFLKFYTNYNILLKLAKIKINIINLTNNIGSFNIENLIVLYLGNYKNNKQLSEIYHEHINFHNQLFNPIKCELYECDNDANITFKLNTYGKKNKTSSITLATYQLDLPSVNKYNVFTKSLILKIMGAKIFIPYGNKLLIVYGYYNNDDMNLYQKHSIFSQKYNKTTKLFSNLDINDSFKNNFLDTLSITDFLLNSDSQLAGMCVSYNGDLIKYKSKNISQIVKEFVVSELDKQRYMISLLLIDTDDDDSGYLAHLLFDLLKSDSQVALSPKVSGIIYDSLHWKLKKIFKESDEIVDSINEKIGNFNEDTIPYEKRIHLMKADEIVKSKAMDKLKEINNSKNGESNAKAQQYLDGLLKIPFGNYKKESIRIRLDDVKQKYEKLLNIIIREIEYVEENNKLNDKGLEKTAELLSFLKDFEETRKNPINISKLNKNLKRWIKEILNINFKLYNIYDKDNLINFLKTQKVSILKDLCKKCYVNVGGKKNNIIDCILDHNYSSDDNIHLNSILNLPKMFTQLADTEQFVTILATIEQLNNIWTKYNENQSKYFKEVSRKLDNAVYGLDDAKNQIKRLLAQWVNGNDQGYVFGFEGPPGTGKTTLAKKGIACCLLDELNNPRPFVFIALGGSSNGSTLEGHNYTYVGSTWGRIIDGVIDSKCMNPIIYIDELDKISRTEHGKEIIGILTHMTDPSQNAEFTDKYFSGIKFDISKCLIIFSYNDSSIIDKILLDRIQKVKISSLNKEDKIMVSRKHIIPEILDNIGFCEEDILIEDSVLSYIIDTYTYEAGARKLKEKLYEIYREINLKYLIAGEDNIPFNITKEFIDKIFENYDQVDKKVIHNIPKPGLVNGLYATASGIGGITVIECFKYATSTHLDLKLTGSQGDVMKESMNVAKTVALNVIPLDVLSKIEDDSQKFGIHIHCPSGGTPKDGPSAGTAITVCIISLLCNIPVKNTMGITGEIDLNGNVLQIGGLESKVDGGKNAGVKHILCPEKNKIDLAKIRKRNNPPEGKDFKVETINTIYDALEKFLIMPKNTSVKTYFRKI